MGRLVTLAERIEQGMESSQEQAGAAVAYLQRPLRDSLRTRRRAWGSRTARRARAGTARGPRPDRRRLFTAQPCSSCAARPSATCRGAES